VCKYRRLNANRRVIAARKLDDDLVDTIVLSNGHDARLDFERFMDLASDQHRVTELRADDCDPSFARHFAPVRTRDIQLGKVGKTLLVRGEDGLRSDTSVRTLTTSLTGFAPLTKHTSPDSVDARCGSRT
jgi:hypothetical protein